jgi:hypothetical protein
MEGKGVTDWEAHDKVKQYDWQQIANEFCSSGHNRSPGQCKSHWLNVLRPGIDNGPWTRDDVLQLLEKEPQEPYWTNMERYFNGRTRQNIEKTCNKVLSKGICDVVMQAEKLCDGCCKCLAHVVLKEQMTGTEGVDPLQPEASTL